jgi:hypothetical protein
MSKTGVARLKCPKCGEHKMVLGSTAQSGRKRYVCRTGCQYQTTDPNAPYRGKGEPEKKLIFKQKIANRTLVITWAQNATPVHAGFFGALKAYCLENNAKLLVIPGRYKNPTSRWEESQRNMQWWMPELVPHLVNVRKLINKNLMLLADIHTQPTAVTPLSGFESITHAESGILGHPKLQMTVIPTPHKRLPKILTTTGAVTVKNYSDTKAGAKGDFHHVQGAVVVEFADHGVFHLRHLNARSDGAFCDLDKAYFPDGAVRTSGPYQGLVFGDAHARFADKSVVASTFGVGGLVDRLNPQQLVFHDLLDSYAVNPHHEGNPFLAAAKKSDDFNNIWTEVNYTIAWLNKVSKGRQAVVVPSNHDDMLSRWMKRCDWREDVENAEFYLETALHMVRGSRIANNGCETPDPFLYWVRKANLKNVRCLERNESFTIDDIECSLHGDQGPNGARGSLKNLSKLGVKVISGHSHTPGIEAGHYRTGTMTPLSLEYTGPVGSWLNAHVSIDPMGKRHIHICVDGRFWK